MSHFVEDRNIEWVDESLDDLLSLKSLNPINAMATVNKTIKEAEKLGFKQAEGPKNIQSVEDSNLEVFENLDLLSFVNKLVDDTKKQTLGT